METINFKETARKQSRTKHNNMILVEMEGGGERRVGRLCHYILSLMSSLHDFISSCVIVIGRSERIINWSYMSFEIRKQRKTKIT